MLLRNPNKYVYTKLENDISSYRFTFKIQVLSRLKCIIYANILFLPGHDDVVNFLLHHFRRIRFDQVNHLGFTALMKAAIQGRTRCAKLLLFAGDYACINTFIYKIALMLGYG